MTLVRPEDALGVALAYYATYGDAFPLDYVYDPEEIIRRNTADDQHTVVIRTPKGEIVGLFALFRYAPNPDVYEAGQLMILKSYRHRDLGTKLSVEALDNLPGRLGIPVVFLEALGDHARSQELAYRKGLAFTGLEVECMPPHGPTKEDVGSRNDSLFLMFKAFQKTACRVHPPEAYRSFCDAMYAQLALPRAVAPASPLTGDTLASHFFLRECSLLRLTVTRAGRDFDETVTAAEAKAGDRGVVQVFLNLGDAATPSAVEVLRERGYFLAGLLPYWFGADGLLMQKVGREPDWDAICAFGSQGVAMRDTIREDFERAKSRGPGFFR